MSICSTAPSCLLACCCHSLQHHICLEFIILVFYHTKRWERKGVNKHSAEKWTKYHFNSSWHGPLQVTRKLFIYLVFGRRSKLDTKGAKEGRSHVLFQAGTPELVWWYLTAMSMVWDNSAWAGVLCPPPQPLCITREVGGLDSSENCPLDLV